MTSKEKLCYLLDDMEWVAETTLTLWRQAQAAAANIEQLESGNIRRDVGICYMSAAIDNAIRQQAFLDQLRAIAQNLVETEMGVGQ